jgi:hypothetical protein
MNCELKMQELSMDFSYLWTRSTWMGDMVSSLYVPKEIHRTLALLYSVPSIISCNFQSMLYCTFLVETILKTKEKNRNLSPNSGILLQSFATTQISNYGIVIRNQDFQCKRKEINYKIKGVRLKPVILELSWK